MGWNDLKRVAAHARVQVVGMVDVDRRNLYHERTDKFTDAARFADYREMLRKLGDKVDGVVISTPDHTHYPAARMAMEMNKAVYCQKPLTHTVAEARALTSLAKETGLVTQMGIHVHSAEAYRMAVNFLQQGVIGKVSKVYAWSNKSWGYDGAPYQGKDPVPEHLDWNLWLGGAGARPYLAEKYHPEQWRRLNDFGTGTLGDMGVHILDTPYGALGLTQPLSVTATCRPPNDFSHPTKNKVSYQFPGTKYTTERLELTWFDGAYANQLDQPELELEPGKELPGQGAMFIGEDGKRLLLPHVTGPQPLPRKLLANITKPVLESVNHYHQWVDAAMGKGACSAPFEYSGPLTSFVQLGVLSARFPGKTLLWDSARMRFTNHTAANQFLSKTYRTNY